MTRGIWILSIKIFYNCVHMNENCNSYVHTYARIHTCIHITHVIKEQVFKK